MIVTHADLTEALAELCDENSLHVDLAPLLGIGQPVRVGVDDVQSLLLTGEPTFSIEVGPVDVTVRKGDGSMLTGLQFKF